MALRKVFEYWGYRECTPDETLALSAQFQGNPTPMQIMQLFRNWGQEKRRQDRDPDNLPRSHQPRRKDILQAQPTSVRTINISILKIVHRCVDLMILRFSCTLLVESK